MNPFYFACGQFGAEKAIKAEVTQAYPELKFAFSRPGFVTFKGEPGCDRSQPHSDWIFTRLWGRSVGQARGEGALQQLQAYLGSLQSNRAVHFFERDLHVPGDEPENWVHRARLDQELEQDWRRAHVPGADRAPRAQETVTDVIWLDPGHWFWGEHEHSALLEVSPGNQTTLELPKMAPSRAYLKVAEASLRFGLRFQPGQRLLEVGCSPGGATSFFLAQGLQVVGVDPKRLDDSIHAKPTFRLIQKLAKTITAEELGREPFDWIAMDMNLQPVEALNELAHVLKLVRKIPGQKKLLGGLITLKLNDWALSLDSGKYLARLRELGLEPVRKMQLCSNRQEFFVFARERE